jgi:RNA polymerase sigma-70 factor (ECF subfamily)
VSASPTLVSDQSIAYETVPAADSASLLYERYYDRILGYCLYQLGSREEAEDAAQTTFMWAFRGLRRGVIPRAEASWLFTIAQNACRARHRSRGRRREREVLSDPVILADMSPAHAADSDDLMGLEDALARMPELQRRAILLREWRGLSYREIAAELELSGAAVETLIFRARRSLAELLAGRPAPKRARSYAFDFGSIGAALKSVLGAGSCAKLVAGAAAIVAATTLAGSVERAGGKNEAPAPAVAPSVSHVAPSVSHHDTRRSSSASAQQPPTKKPAAQQTAKPRQGPAEPPKGTSGGSPTLDQAIADPAEILPPLSSVVDPLPVTAATDAVDESVEAVKAVLDVPVADALP